MGNLITSSNIHNGQATEHANYYIGKSEMMGKSLSESCTVTF